MRTVWKTALALALPFFSGTLPAADAIRAEGIGLSRTGVFDDPDPEVFAYRDAEPERAGTLPRAYQGAPPQVPHRVDRFLPLTMAQNECLRCHDKPKMIGKKLKGLPTPMPRSHYAEKEGQPVRANGRHVCVQCHTPQAEVRDLISNTFSPK